MFNQLGKRSERFDDRAIDDKDGTDLQKGHPANVITVFRLALGRFFTATGMAMSRMQRPVQVGVGSRHPHHQDQSNQQKPDKSSDAVL